MKVMHLSDLHLGKSILEQSLIEDQKYILNQIIDIVREKKVDVVFIAGDVYDKGIPNVEAVRLFSEFLTKLYQLKVKVFVISGNHDSKDRLSFGNELFVDNGVYIEGVFNGNLKKNVVFDEFGEMCIYLLPFVKPADVRIYYPEEEINSYHQAVECIIKHTEIDKTKRNVILVHQFVTSNGAELEYGGSENLSLGGLDNIDVSLFEEFDYVALGHIHRGQKLIRDTIRYAGSPLKYSFNEVHQRKSVPIVTFFEKGNIDIDLVDLVPLRDMRAIQGTLEHLLDKDVVSLGNPDDYISAIITDEDYIMDVIGKLRMVYKNILRLEYQNSRTLGVFSEKNMAQGEIHLRSELDLFEEFYLNQNHIELDEERTQIVHKVISQLKEKVDL